MDAVGADSQSASTSRARPSVSTRHPSTLTFLMMQVSVPLRPAELLRTLLRSVSPKEWDVSGMATAHNRIRSVDMWADRGRYGVSRRVRIAKMASKPHQKLGCHLSGGDSNGYFCSLIFTLAIVFSHSSLRTAESSPILSKEIVNISRPEGRCVTVIGIRARS